MFQNGTDFGGKAFKEVCNLNEAIGWVLMNLSYPEKRNFGNAEERPCENTERRTSANQKKRPHKHVKLEAGGPKFDMLASEETKSATP